MLVLKFVALIVLAPGLLLTALWVLALLLAGSALFWLWLLHAFVSVLENKGRAGA
jgi:fatty acid desaturase